MIEESRLQKSTKNMFSGALFRIFSFFTAFIVRKIFIVYLGNAYLSVNGLYTSILSMLSLAELGFGTAMVYSMYKPLADKDYRKLTQIMNLYKRAYFFIGSFILVAGLCLVPFLDNIIKNKPDIPGLTFYYLLFLFNSVISYWFFAYRSSVLQADQRSSVIANYSTLFNALKTILQIVVLVIFHNFTIYLVMQIGCTILQNITISLKVTKDYPIFNKEENSELPASEKKKIFSDVRALMIQKISFKVLNTSDSLIISSFIGVNWVGLLSNFIMVEEAVVSFISQIFTSITASLGNFFAKESKVNGYHLFKRLFFMNYWLYGFSTVALISLLNPFIELWLGKEYTLSQFIIVALVIRFFIEGYMNLMSTFRATLGLFTQGKYFPLIVASINIFLSIGLSYPFGVAGVLIATPLSRCVINAWYMPLIIHRDGFQQSVKTFYFECIKKWLILAIITIINYKVVSIILCRHVTFVSFSLATIVTAFLPNAFLLVIYFRTDDFQYFINILKRFRTRR